MSNTKDGFKPGHIIKTWAIFLGKSLGILLIAGIIGILLLTLAYCIPVNQESKESTFTYSGAMGWAPIVNNRYEQYISRFTSYEIGTLDDGTDLIILNDCYDEGQDSAIVRAADMRGYGRYWHGYVMLLRPIFYFIDYWDYLLVNSFAQLFVMGCVAYAIMKVTGKKRYLLAFFCSCAFLTPAATAMSLQNSPVFYISMLGSAFCLLKSDWILEKDRRYYVFLILGILTCYFDFLTYPLLSFVFPFCWLLVAADAKMDLLSRCKLLFGGGVSFILGWGGFFCVKWLVQTIVCGPEILSDGLGTVEEHLGGFPDEYRLLHQTYCKIDTLYNNFRHYLFPLFILLLTAWICVFLYKYLCGGLRVKAEQLAFAAVTLTSPAWYFVMNRHTSIHHLFTYRIYGASLLGFMLFVCGCMGECVYNREWKVYLKRCLVLLCCLVIGVGASRLAKEDKTIINGGDNTEMILAEGDTLDFEFTPSVENIKGFSFCIRPNGSLQGDIVIELYDGETLCETTEIPVDTYEGTVFAIQYTDWKLTAGKQYDMKVSVKDNDKGVTILVTPEGEAPLVEYGNAFLNGEQLPAIQPLSGITYRGHLQTAPVKLFLSACVAAFVLMWIISLQVFWKKKNI